MIQLSLALKRISYDTVFKVSSGPDRGYLLTQLLSHHFGWPLKPIFAYIPIVQRKTFSIYASSQDDVIIEDRLRLVVVRPVSDTPQTAQKKLVVKSGLANNHVYLGEQQKLKDVVINFKQGSNNLVIIDDQVDLNQVTINLKGDNNIVFIGSMLTCGSGHFNVGENNKLLYMGAEGMFSTRIMADTSDSHSIYDLDTKQMINFSKSIIIGPKVWLGRDVILSKGTVIGHQSVIGQASIVNGEVKPQSIYAGIPARCIKSHITWSRMRCDSIAEMEASPRHQVYLNKKNQSLNRHYTPPLAQGHQEQLNQISMRLYQLRVEHG